MAEIDVKWEGIINMGHTPEKQYIAILEEMYKDIQSPIKHSLSL